MKKDKFMEKVSSYMEEYRMLQPGDAVVVGVSGGADSVCLLFLLCKIREQLQLKLQVVHVNHGLRETADRDSQFVLQICEKWGVPVSCVTFRVSDIAEEEGMSVEEAGRKVRYQSFEKAAAELAEHYPDLPREPRVAVAHHANDNAETMIFRLARGTGLRGMAGIPPVRGNIVRPLLCVERREIEEYLKAAKIQWVTDETNEDDTIVRNRIRHRIVPEMEDLSKTSVLRMFDASKRFREAEDYLEQQANAAIVDIYGQDWKKHAGIGIYGYDTHVSSLRKYHIAIQERIILLILEALAPEGRNIGSVQVDQVLDLIHRPGDRKICLPYGLEAYYMNGYLGIWQGEKWNPEALRESERDPECDRFEPEGYLSVTSMEENALDTVTPWTEFEGNPYTKLMDCDKIKKSFVLRTRRVGDFIRINGQDGELVTQSLKNYFINSKIPAEQRDRILLMASGSEIYWIIGYRMSDAVKILQDTTNIIRVDYVKE